MDSHVDMPESFRAVLLVEYIGTSFSGSQVQKNGLTVQQAFEEALARLNIKARRPVFSGRTDAGVHARGQVAHVACAPESLDRIPDLAAALNAHLPSDISVKDYALDETNQFHAIKHAQWRWYRYKIHNCPRRSVWTQPDSLWFRHPLDVDKMSQGARYLLGTHDFASFKCPRTEEKNNVCTVIHSHIYREGDVIVYDVVANRFIYKMIRNIMGTLIDIGSHQDRSPSEIPTILAHKNRQFAGPTAAPEGLTLMAVNYPKPWDFFHQDICVKTLTQAVQESSTHENLLRKAS